MSSTKDVKQTRNDLTNFPLLVVLVYGNSTTFSVYSLLVLVYHFEFVGSGAVVAISEWKLSSVLELIQRVRQEASFTSASLRGDPIRLTL